MLTVDINKQSWETGYKVIREVAKTDGKQEEEKEKEKEERKPPERTHSHYIC